MEIQPRYVWRKAKEIAFADKIIKAKNNNPWEAIELMFDYWRKQNPAEYNAFVIEVEGVRQTRANSLGASTNKNSGMRYTLDIPAQVWNMIVAVFGDKETLDIYSKDFFRELGKRFPFLKVAERL